MAEPTSKGPLSYLSGSLTSGAFCAISVWITLKLITYYSLHPPQYSQRFAQSIATALKTLIIGSGCVAVFSSLPERDQTGCLAWVNCSFAMTPHDLGLLALLLSPGLLLSVLLLATFAAGG